MAACVFVYKSTLYAAMPLSGSWKPDQLACLETVSDENASSAVPSFPSESHTVPGSGEVMSTNTVRSHSICIYIQKDSWGIYLVLYKLIKNVKNTFVKILMFKSR